MPQEYETDFRVEQLGGRKPVTMPVTRNQAASSTSDGEEDTLQRLLQAVASLQACSEEQSRLSAEAEQRQIEAEERDKEAEERHRETLRMAKQREEELRHQLAAVKATIEKPVGQLPAASSPTFWNWWSTRHPFPRVFGS
ncbi:hypothetical protein CR513_49659, partial [Mucuna pruriens]